jgi:TonB family protein
LPGPQTFVLSRDGYFKATVILHITDAMAGRAESRTVVMIHKKGKGGSGALSSGGRANAALKGALANAVAAANVIGEPPAAPATPIMDSNIPAPVEPTPASPPQAKSTALPTAANTADHVPVSPPVALAAPSPGPAVPAVLAFGPEMTRPSLISGGELAYPREAMVAGVSATIIAKCTITAEGSLRSCRIIKGLPFLDKAALDVLATRRYSPVMYQGKAVSVEYVFNLKVAPPTPR